jgi:hypothetical protein
MAGRLESPEIDFDYGLFMAFLRTMRKKNVAASALLCAGHSQTTSCATHGLLLI